MESHWKSHTNIIITYRLYLVAMTKPSQNAERYQQDTTDAIKIAMIHIIR